MEAIELCEVFKEELEQYAISLEIYHSKKGPKPEKPTPSIKFLGRNIFEHMELHLKRIRSAELENTLRFLNMKQSFQMLFYLEYMLRCEKEPELAARATLQILKTYHI